MTDMAPEVPQGGITEPVVNDVDLTGGTGPEESLKVNPAWQPVLDKLPTSLHHLVIPELQNHNKNVDKLVNQVHSRYEPYKQFIENKVDPRVLDEGVRVYQALQADPVQFVKAVQQYYGHLFQPEQGPVQQLPQGEEVDEALDSPFSLEKDPHFQRYQQMTETMAQALLQQHQEQQMAMEDAQLDADLEAAREKYGEFDDDYVMALAEFKTDGNIDEAVQMYIAKRDSIIASHRNPSATAPILMGSGGGSPAPTIPVNSLDANGRKNLVAQLLARAKAQEGM